MSDDGLDRIWRRRILPGIEAMAVPCAEPVTVFLGGQPAAGKTRAQRRVVDLYGGGMLPIVGDDFRQYHPDYVRLVREDPVGMPDATARAAGYWTGMAVAYADTHDVSCIIEGTWRNRDTVLSEARRSMDLGRRNHAVVLAVPPVLSRLGLLRRFYMDLYAGRQARWTPPTAHEATVGALPGTVAAVAASGLFGRFTVLGRDGGIVCDGADPAVFVREWDRAFHRVLSAEESADASERLDEVEAVRDLLGVGTPSSDALILSIRRSLDELA